MEFSSLFFIYVFLPLTAAIYFLIPGIRRKNVVLIAASLLFYAMGQPVYLLLLLGLSYVNYYFGTLLAEKNRKLLIIAVSVNLLALGLFKYLDFLLGIFGLHVDRREHPHPEWQRVLLLRADGRAQAPVRRPDVL